MPWQLQQSHHSPYQSAGFQSLAPVSDCSSWPVQTLGVRSKDSRSQSSNRPCGRPGLHACSRLWPPALLQPIPDLAGIWAVNQLMGDLFNSLSDKCIFENLKLKECVESEMHNKENRNNYFQFKKTIPAILLHRCKFKAETKILAVPFNL